MMMMMMSLDGIQGGQMTGLQGNFASLRKTTESDSKNEKTFEVPEKFKDKLQNEGFNWGAVAGVTAVGTASTAGYNIFEFLEHRGGLNLGLDKSHSWKGTGKWAAIGAGVSALAGLGLAKWSQTKSIEVNKEFKTNLEKLAEKGLDLNKIDYKDLQDFGKTVNYNAKA